MFKPRNEAAAQIDARVIDMLDGYSAFQLVSTVQRAEDQLDLIFKESDAQYLDATRSEEANTFCLIQYFALFMLRKMPDVAVAGWGHA